MPIEDTDQGLARIPDLEIANLKFSLSTPKYKNNAEMKAKLMELIIRDGEHTIFNVFSIIDNRSRNGPMLPSLLRRTALAKR